MDPRALNELIPDWKEQDAPLDTPVQRRPLPHLLPRRGGFRRAQRPAARLLPQPRQLRRQPRQRLPLAGAAGRGARRGNLPGLRRRRGALRRGWRGQGCRHRRHGRRPRRPADGRLPAGHGTAARSTPSSPKAAAATSASSWRRSSTCATAPTRRSTASASRNCGRSGRSSIARAWSCTPPAGRWTADTYGGCFVYHLEDNLVAIGFVVGLGYSNPLPLSLRGIPALQDSSGDQALPRRRQAHRLRRARPRGRRPAGAAEADLPRRRPDRRRCRLPQRLAHQGLARRASRPACWPPKRSPRRSAPAAAATNSTDYPRPVPRVLALRRTAPRAQLQAVDEQGPAGWAR